MPSLRLCLLLVIPLLVTAEAASAQDPAAAQAEDPYLWLEDVEGRRALDWVEQRSGETLRELEQHPAYDSIYQEALEILGSDDRIAYPSIMGDRLYNFWTDDDHPRGIWRRTTWESYLSGNPEWETVLDIDALAALEGVPWAFGGATCLAPAYERCMVSLSRGGADAAEVREFDLEAARFIDDGFFIPEAKSSVAWKGPDTLLVATDFGDGSLTTSGYPREVRIWARGESLASAPTLFQAPREDMGVWVGSLETADTTYQIVSHRPSFFEGTVSVLQDGELVTLDVPLDADPMLVGDQLVVYVRSEWEVGGRTFPQGAVAAMDYASFMAGERDFELVVEPGERQTVQGVSQTRDHLLVSMLDNVRGQLWRHWLEDGEWRRERVESPGLGTVNVVATDPHTSRFFFNGSGFTQPSTLYLAEADGSVRPVRQLPEMFEAEGLVVEQQQATSRDGTRIPFFIIRPEGMPRDGASPTLLYGYGGFEVAMTPSYNAMVGRAWLERGGVYVVANIRGGGEFGPAWHRAALKENRQLAFDDFLAVAEWLVDNGVTSPDHLGIMGGSNGGLLVGVAMTQRPELFDAVVIQVPLLDMRRYNKLLAGASWMAEYGNPDVPEEWAYIREYSPYHNLDPNADYPVPFIYTTTRDDRVHPGHARKMAARMEAIGHPVYYYENTEGGHGAGVTPEQRARMIALTYAYLLQRLVG